MKRKLALTLLATAALGAGVYAYAAGIVHMPAPQTPAPPKQAEATLPAVTVTPVVTTAFDETVTVTGSLVPRLDILVAPEVEGLRVLELFVDEGDRVKKGQLLARLSSETLEAQVAQSDANLARNAAAIAQARSNIVQAEARVVEARNAFERAKPLKNSGYMAELTYDTRQAAARTADAQLAAAKDGLTVAEAERAQIQAQRREIEWRRSRTEVKAPADGVVSRRNARIGGIAAGAADPMFRIIANGEVELDAEVPEMQIGKIKEGQTARVSAAGIDDVSGKVRLVSPEIDKTTRLGRVRIFLGDDPRLRIGSFARGTVATARSRGLGVPVSAVVYNGDVTTVQVVTDSVVQTRAIKTGLTADGMVEVREGLSEGAQVVTRAGTFLRDGDRVRAVVPDSNKLSGIQN